METWEIFFLAGIVASFVTFAGVLAVLSSRR
jgi:hypothetical protein